MSIYDINGNTLTRAYDVFGAELNHAYDINGTEVFGGGGIEPMDWSNIPTVYRTAIADAVTQVRTYLNGHSGAYAFPVLTDVHIRFYNEPNYLIYNNQGLFDKFLFLGDIANAYSVTELDGAVYYMLGAYTDILPLVGNHELANYAEGDTLPKAWYRPPLPESAVVMDGEPLVYYYDDDANNVRYIALDSCTPIKKSAGSQLLTKNELEFMASALGTANGRDIILLNHTPGQSYHPLANPSETVASTTVANTTTTMKSIISAFISRGTYSFADDSGVTHAHDYSSATGSFIGYFTGHMHQAGYNSSQGYNMFTCPSSYFNDAGMSMFVIDRTAKKVIWFIAYKAGTVGTHEYAFEVTTS